MASHTRLSSDELKQLDMQITRGRLLRRIVPFVTPPLVVWFGYLAGTLVATLIGVPVWFGMIVGIASGSAAAVWAWSRSWITNGTYYANITLDPIQAFFNLNPVVCYGPGSHPCLWWEDRSDGNTVYLGEVTEPFSSEVQLSKGVVRFDGSIRLRANIKELHKFVSGAGAAAADIKGLVVAHILREVGGSDQNIQDILKSATRLDKSLAETFTHGNGSAVSEDFEGRFGLIVGDVTIEKVSAEGIEETLNALSEAAIVDQIVANSFGCKDAAELQTKVEAKIIGAQEVRHRRNQTLAHSGNLQGMSFEDKTLNFNVTGIDPKLAQALINGLPALAVVGKTLSGGNDRKKGGKK